MVVMESDRVSTNRFKVNPCVSIVFTHNIIGLCVCVYKSADGYDFTMNAKIYALENRFFSRIASGDDVGGNKKKEREIEKDKEKRDLTR